MLKGKITNLKILPVPLFLIILAFAPQFLGIYYLGVLRDVLVWIALSISWHFFSGLTKYISLGSAAFFGIGLYMTAKYLQLSAYYGYPTLPFPAIVLLAGLITFALALLIGLVTLRLKGIYFAILTFGVMMVFQSALKWYETNIARVSGVSFPSFNSQTQYYSILITMLAILLLTTFLRRSKFGLALRMVGENEEAAVHVGVNTSLYKTLGFAISAMCMGLMGGSCATRVPFTNTDFAFNPNYSFLPAIMTLLGGAGTVFGPMIGSITLSLLYEYLRVTFSYYFLIILGSILVAVVLFMPNGIMGIVGKLKATKLTWRKELAKAPKRPP
jgi:branched-chain amino acid transport system permease protein